MKEEKAVAKALENEQKEAATTEKKALALQARKEKAAAKKVEREAAKKQAETSDESTSEAPLSVVVEELEEEVILSELDIDSSDDEADDIAELDSSNDEEEFELSSLPIKIVGGVEYRVLEQDGQTILFSKLGDPVGVYDADTDTVQEAEFDEE